MVSTGRAGRTPSGRPGQIPITIVLIGGALLAATARRRFTAVLYLSCVGYGMAALFVLQGAPDLALTQAAVETLSTVLFVLVLRKLPDRFERRSSVLTRGVRISIAVGVALMVFFFDIVARQARTAPPVSTEMVERALPDAEGRNVVNVILVDFRGLDTLGEITVLAAASIGAVALARAGRRPRRDVAGPPWRRRQVDEAAAPPASGHDDRSHRTVDAGDLSRRSAGVGVPARRRPQPPWRGVRRGARRRRRGDGALRHGRNRRRPIAGPGAAVDDPR